MHAVVVRVSIGDPEKAQQGLREQVIPRVSQAPGFVAGYWTRSDDGSNGISMIVFESEEAAQQAADRFRTDPPPSVSPISIDVGEVLEHA